MTTKNFSKRRVVLAATLLTFAAAAVAIRSPARAKPEPPPPLPTVVVSPPLKQHVTGSDAYVGRFEAAESVDIRPRVGGYVDRVTFRDGDSVTKGQLLFVIDPRPYRAVVAQAEGRLADARSALALADAELQRAKRLIDSGSIAQSIFDQKRQIQQAAEAAVTVADATLASARLDLDFTEVRAPMAGRIGRHLVSAGNVVQSGTSNATLLTTIVSTDPIHFYFDIDEESYLRYGQLARAGQRSSAGGVGGKVSIALPAETKASHTGVLDFADNRLDRSTGTLRARARVANADGSLTPGQFGRVEIEGDAAHLALLVPDSAISTDATDKVIGIVGDDDRVAVRSVVLGRLFGELREVRSGLQAEDRIVVSKLQHARTGDKVVPHFQPLDANRVLLSGSAE